MVKQSIKMSSSCFSYANIVTQGKRKNLSIKCDLKLLNRLKEPTSVYDLVKDGYAHSSAHYTLKHYLSQGIIKVVKTEKIESGFGIKKLYMLTDLGFSLLGIFKKINENMFQDSIDKKRS